MRSSAERAPRLERTERGDPAHPAAWLAVAALLATGTLVAAALGQPDSWAWRPHRAAEAPWTAWSAAWLHLNDRHLAVNLAGLALVAALGPMARLGPSAAIAWLAAWPLTQAALLLRPDLVRYVGLSGVLHAALAIAGMVLVLRRNRGQRHGAALRALGALLIAGLVAKVVLEAPLDAVTRFAPALDMPVAPVAHLCGLVVGLVCGAVAAWWT